MTQKTMESPLTGEALAAAPDGRITLSESETAIINQLRDQVRALKDAEEKGWKQLGEESDIAHQTLGLFVTGKYEGDVRGVALKVKRWLDSRAAAREAMTAAPEDLPFILTAAVQEITLCLEYARARPSCGLIVTAPGLSKTTTLKQYAANNPNAHYVHIDPSAANTYPLLSAVARELEVEERDPAKRYVAIGQRLRGRRALLMIDEAQRCTPAALEQLRALHDEFGIGLALSGNKTLIAKIDEMAKGVDGAQLKRRVGRRVIRKEASDADLARIIDVAGLTDEPIRKFLVAVGRKPGAIGLLCNTIWNARFLAASEGREVTLETVKRAFADLEFSAA